jgi:hypothetical protein
MTEIGYDPSSYEDWARQNKQKKENEMVSEVDKKQVGGDHYKKRGLQPWEAMEAWATKDEFLGHLRLTAIKYLARAGDKGPIDIDIEKALHYLEKWLAVYRKQEQ